MTVNADNNIKINEKKIEKLERNFLFDNIKAILIFFVVLAHYYRMSDSFTLTSFGGVAYFVSFSYIMQGFLFVSGYFSRNLVKCRATAFKTFFFPYIILMPIMFSVRYLIFGNAQLDYTLPTMALWYLLTLFYYRYLLKDFVRIKKILPISIVISLAAGFVPFLDSTLSMGRAFGFLPFFLLGYYFKAEWIEKLRKIPKGAIFLLLAGLLSYSIFISYKEIIPLDALFLESSYISTGLTNLQGIAVRIILFIISMAWMLVFINLTPNKKTKLVRFGQNTMTIYLLHIPVRYVIKRFSSSFGQDIPSYLILSAAVILSLWIFSIPKVAKLYQDLMDLLYQWIISYPLALIRRIL